MGRRPDRSRILHLEKFNGLPKNYQRVLTDACARVNALMLEKYDALNAKALRELVAQGAILRPFSQDILEACYKAAQETYSEISASNAAFKKIYDSQQAFKKDGYLWLQIADYSFDTFMMIQQRNGSL